ncbi:MAG: Fe-S cluster assembly scaffold protein NifU [Desulfosoma sp.]|uniref:Fe-S cluster assembly scaffold protein NifU n=1 Tax=Desulfosoma sp. TaxID=2603217 RepID=UPI00404939D5
MYSQKVMEHFANPRNAGVLEDADGVGEVGNPVCGDMMAVYVKVKDDRIADAKFQTFGCVAANAVSSMVTEMAKGKTLSEAKQITKKAVAEALEGLPKEKMHCSNLGAEALAEAIKEYEERRRGLKPAAEKAGRRKRASVRGCCGVPNPLVAQFCMSCGHELNT